jgi:phospholipid/cholesterol/gamma-HCH transport system substrate-binding protein
MKINNETKIGIITVSALTILILGFNFLKGKDIFMKKRYIYAVFSDLGSLSKSNTVTINGYVIGNVSNLKARDKDISGIVATITLTQDVHIPRDSKAYISTPLVGGSVIVIEKGTDSVFLNLGDTILTRRDNGILDDVRAQFAPTLTKVRNSLDSLDIVLNNLNRILSNENRDNIKQTLANLNAASNSLNGLMDNQTEALAKTLNNAEEFTADLKKNTDNINKTIANAKTASEKLAALDVQPTIDAINELVGKLKSVVAKIDSKDGTLGALLNDKTLYNKLNDAILAAEILIDDLRIHPKRYTTILTKKVKYDPLTSPAKKDSIHK